uniref:Uncharacterized protein n=1 Tax=Arundo donax TaxID=35708 RepID=A0A0A9GAV9_ARUDO
MKATRFVVTLHCHVGMNLRRETATVTSAWCLAIEIRDKRAQICNYRLHVLKTKKNSTGGGWPVQKCGTSLRGVGGSCCLAPGLRSCRRYGSHLPRGSFLSVFSLP